MLCGILEITHQRIDVGKNISVYALKKILVYVIVFRKGFYLVGAINISFVDFRDARDFAMDKK